MIPENSRVSVSRHVPPGGHMQPRTAMNVPTTDKRINVTMRCGAGEME